MKEINIGLLGCGTVGTGVARLLLENEDLISKRVGAKLALKWVADVDIETDRGIQFDEGVLIDDARKVVDDPEIAFDFRYLEIGSDVRVYGLSRGDGTFMAERLVFVGTGDVGIGTSSSL